MMPHPACCLRTRKRERPKYTGGHQEFGPSRFCQACIIQQRTVERDITLYAGSEIHMNAHGNVLLNAENKRIGAVVVLNDVTRLRRLEDIRREFVANVSHEIKTPITAIKGAAETLQNGALEDPSKTSRFLEMIRRHADRLEEIVEDLLSLSRIEQETESKGLSSDGKIFEIFLCLLFRYVKQALDPNRYLLN